MKIAEFTNDSMNYILARPELESMELPLLVYLHGAGERGERLDHLYRHGIPKLLGEGREYEAYILAPQCPRGFVWNNVVAELKELIDRTVAELGVKPDRILLTGSSMGGYGTWEMGLTYRNFFAAIAPVAGGGMPWRCSCLRTTPVLAYHGSADNCVVPECSRMMVDAVNRTGGSAELMLLEGFGHNDGIDYAYREGGLVERLLAFRRRDFTYVPDFCEEWF